METFQIQKHTVNYSTTARTLPSMKTGSHKACLAFVTCSEQASTCLQRVCCAERGAKRGLWESPVVSAQEGGSHSQRAHSPLAQCVVCGPKSHSGQETHGGW